MVSSINSKINPRKIWVSLPNVISGADLGENHIKLLKRPEIIGVILFYDNLDKSHVNHPKEAFLSIKNLIKSIKKINNNLILSIDHEGGLIYRFNCIFRPPAAKFFGNLYKKDKKSALNQCERASYLAGLDLKKLGIDVCFSPVCDIHDSRSQVIGAKLRAFSDNISIICDLSIAWLKGLNQAEYDLLMAHSLQLALYHSVLEKIERNKPENKRREVVLPGLLVGVTGRLLIYPEEMFNDARSRLENIFIKAAKIYLSSVVDDKTLNRRILE